MYSHIDERRRYICWFIHRLFPIDMTKVVEIYVDSTHKTNVNKAELFSIIGEEGGVGVPLGYMLMEKKPTEDSRLFPGEVTACCTRFYSYAHALGLNPTFLHTDKCTSEIGGLQVSSACRVIV